MELLPAVDVLNGAVVRLRQGRKEDVTVYANDPATQLRTWADQGASLVHVVDLSGAIEGTWNSSLWRELGGTGVRFQAGGGIRSLEAAVQTIAAGVDRVVLGSTVVWNPTMLASMVVTLGPDRVVAAVDVRDGMAVGTGWTDAGRPLDQVLDQLAGAGVIRALVTGIAGDGMLTGPAVDLLNHCVDRVPEVGIIASGGVGTLDDLRRLRSLPLDGVIVGRALYEGAFTLPEGLQAVGGRSDS
ncbi:MAG: 1-(5-phosphoribosyl)-5-[(5-phosphoribosylamino)methylideneamino] imidazole-4-carboxamide isomerase [Acidimicrobiia bacterium]|nr:1-(5-phosphoribosyl)-5-[(5-phosphoribosylamino)methylideneamino] imidazole-4-carboxamide isomerase [Acidimicrobiia bacterium]MDH3396975.1 1-(5-phosphoribosyl)-5-[(5-phosphoribosylamino)methylideneamino] imidazole-4-carboxamide isomerase [Acidimicrobiia bacterium]